MQSSLFDLEPELESTDEPATILPQGMKLVRLTSNKSSFHDVKFNREGISLIVARQQNPEQSDKSRTYNGVGKSLLIAIIHFCLGAKFIESWRASLPDWEWTLDFEVSAGSYSARRTTSQPEKVYLNEEELTLKNFRAKMFSLVVGTDAKIPQLTFRTYIKHFIRPSRQSYTEYLITDKEETDYAALVTNAFLLGLESNLVTRKFEIIRKRQANEGELTRQKKDPAYREVFGAPESVDPNIRYLENQIENLVNRQKAFLVAEDYYDIQRQANEVKQSLQKDRNQLVVLNNLKEKLEKSLKTRPDIAEDQVWRMYEEAKAAMPNRVIQDTKAVLDFHRRLMEKQHARTTRELEKCKDEIKHLQEKVEKQSREMDGLMSYLGAHGALDEYTALATRMGDLRGRRETLIKAKEFSDAKTKIVRQLDKEKLEEDEKTDNYLAEFYAESQPTVVIFESLARRFYPNKPSGLTITNNIGEGALRFNINAFIQDDPSDGINHIKIFCYDMTILQVRPIPGVDFVFHDSRLFGGVDPRQVEVLFSAAIEVTEGAQKQYIVSVNQDTLHGLETSWGHERVQQFVKSHQVLELTDESAEGKLLGIQVDLSYEE